MSTIVLATANARYSHCALGLRSLRANLGPPRARCVIREYTLADRPADVVEDLLSLSPGLVGLSVSIWNATLLGQVALLLKDLRPDLPLVLGGPELIDPEDWPEFAIAADAVVVGEGEVAFAQLVQAWSRSGQIGQRLWRAPVDLSGLALPDAEYSEEDIAHRNIYLESSRGCPFACAFCLSARDGRPRSFPPSAVLASLERLWARGARRFKFVDRSFDLKGSGDILSFFLARCADPALFVHFELTPHTLSDGLLAQLARFPEGSLQLEVGVQTFDPEVAAHIGRRLPIDRVADIIVALRTGTRAHLHTDLLAGLPGQDLAGLGRSFDRLLGLAPHEIQLGALKRLRGAPIAALSGGWGMRYRRQPPYDVLETGAMDFPTLQAVKRFASLFDRVFNSGNFATTAAALLAGESAFDAFWRFCSWFQRRASVDGVGLSRLAQALFEYLTREGNRAPPDVADLLVADYAAAGRTKGLPDAIRRLATINPTVRQDDRGSPLGSADRQARHRRG